MNVDEHKQKRHTGYTRYAALISVGENTACSLTYAPAHYTYCRGTSGSGYLSLTL
jgi:hypothetical protein